MSAQKETKFDHLSLSTSGPEECALTVSIPLAPYPEIIPKDDLKLTHPATSEGSSAAEESLLQQRFSLSFQ